MFPQGGRMNGWWEGRREVRGEKEAGRKGDKVREGNLYLPANTPSRYRTEDTHVLPLKSLSASSADYKYI